MCAVAGILAGPHAPPPHEEELRRMVAVQRHRGPDAWGIYRDGPLALGHARLAIVGIEDGHQPLSNEDGRVWMAGNGEVFNHVELRRELTALGHRFRTGSDMETVVHAWEEWGDGAWPRLNGQFSIVLWDRGRGRLSLVRDPFGILPLLWARVGDALVFASEAKGIFATGRIAPEFDPAGLALVFTRWSATAPRTVFRGLRAVAPGCALHVERDLSFREVRYGAPCLEPSADLEGRSMDELAERLDGALSSAVGLRLRADVPVGCYVSGGLDSAVIGALARRHRNGPLRSYGVGFRDPAYDETDQQRLVAELHGFEHREILCDLPDIARELDRVVWHCETPLLRTGPVPLFHLSRLVRESGQKVVLTGEGADELLAGYAIFKEDRIRRFWARRPESTSRPRLFDRLYDYVGREARSAETWRRFFARDLGAVEHPFYSHLVRWSNTAWSLRFLAPDVRAALEPDLLMDELALALPPGWREWSPLPRAQAIEIATFLSGYLLACQGDRVAMAHGVEVRYPFLDPDVVALCGAMPARARLLGLRDKVVLRRLARGLLPQAVADRPKKPYRAPAGPPLFGAAAPDWVAELLRPAVLARHGVADPETAVRLAAKARARGGVMTSEREEMALVGLVTLQVLAVQFREELRSRVDAASAALERVPPVVDVQALEGVAA